MPTIAAIPTVYAGTRFRSRLEARWAHCLTALGVVWVYEPQPYKLASGYYLPDFWLPTLRAFAEVKPRMPERAVLAKYAELATGTGCRVIVLVDLPAVQAYQTIEPSGRAGSLWLAPAALLHAPCEAARALRFAA